MDKLKYIKLENEDGSYSSSIPLAVDSDHVDVNGNTLTNELSYKANNSSVNNLQNQINSLASGSPLAASSVSGMTDTSRVYVNTTDGKWYYYDGTSWQIGGTYQATEDSNNVNKLISKSNVENMFTYFSPDTTGYINKNNGALVTDLANYKTTDFIPATNFFTIVGKMSPLPNPTYGNINCYDCNKSFLGVGYSSDSSDYKTHNISLPEGTQFIRATIKDTEIDDVFGYTNFLNENKIYSKKSRLYLFSGKISIDTNNKTIGATQQILGFYDGGYLFINTGTNEYSASSLSNTTLLVYDISNSKLDIVTPAQYERNKYNYNYICCIYNSNFYDASVNPDFEIEKNGISKKISEMSLVPMITTEEKNSIKNLKTIKDIMSKVVFGNNIKIKLLGDSITHGYGGTGYTNDAEHGSLIIDAGWRAWYVNTNGYCWANLFKNYMEDKFNCTVNNYGCTGIDSTFLANHLSDLISSDDDIVICMIGTNDRGHNTKEQLKNNIKTIINYCKSNNKEIILMANIPASIEDESGPNGTNFHMEDVNNIIMSVSYEEQTNFISVFNLFNDYCRYRNITLNSLLSDGLHPNDNGYEVMYFLILQELGFSPKISNATW